MKTLALILTVILTGLIASPVWAAQTVVVVPVSANMADGFQTESGIVWTDRLTGFAFYVIASEAGLRYTKTIDGGATWAAGIQVQTSADAANRINNFNVWYDGWTPGDTNTIIHIAWLDTVTDQLLYRRLNATGSVLSTETVVTGLTAFTINVAHNSAGVTITKAQGGNLYIASRSSTSIANGNRFMRSTDNGSNWTTRTISHTPASVQTVKGLIFPGYETDLNDIYGWNLPSGSTAAEIWHYDDSANTWAIVHTITTGNAITATGICPCALAVDAGIAYVGVRDNTTTSSATFYAASIINISAISNLTPVYSAQTNRGEGIALQYDPINNDLIASGVIINAGEQNPTRRISVDDGVTWGTETFIDTVDGMFNPRTQPGSVPSDSSRSTPIWGSTDGGSSSLEIETGFSDELVPVFDPVIPDDGLATKINNVLDAGGFGGVTGQLAFAMATLILLAILLFYVHAPGFVALPMLALWGGGLAVTGFLPPWIPYVAILVAGIGAVLYFTREAGGDSE